MATLYKAWHVLLLALVLPGGTPCAAARHLTAAPAPAAAPKAAPPKAAGAKAALTYAIVGTSQPDCFDDKSKLGKCPSVGQAFYGQDATATLLKDAKPAYVSTNLTVHDPATRLTWTRSPDLNGDGRVTAADKLNYTAALAHCATLNPRELGGHADWRLPTIKELYSLMNFSGTDPDPDSKSTAGLRPFAPTPPLAFAYGDIAAGERSIDAQYASGTTYVAKKTKVFGLNLADGRIKGYDQDGSVPFKWRVLCVRGNPAYGANAFRDNRDGTVTDGATGLMWAKGDSGKGMDWRAALAYAAARNKEGYLGHKDWRVPSIKELQSLVDYGRSPDTTGTPALDPVFDATAIKNERGEKDWPFYWSGTTHIGFKGAKYNYSKAAYVGFGRCLGYLSATSDGQNGILINTGGKPGWDDVHGAGCQRSDPKSGDPAAFPLGFGPQGDAIRISNFVRLVRDA